MASSWAAFDDSDASSRTLPPWADLILQLGPVEQEIVRRQVESVGANPLSPEASLGPERPQPNEDSSA